MAQQAIPPVIHDMVEFSDFYTQVNNVISERQSLLHPEQYKLLTSSVTISWND